MTRRYLLVATAALAIVAGTAAAQIANPDTLYDGGSLSFDYVQTPIPLYSGSFAAEGGALAPDGTLPPGATQAVGGGSVATELDTVATAVYAVVGNPDSTFDGALIALKTIGPLVPGSYPVDAAGGTAVFGFIDDATELALPDSLDQATIRRWLETMTAAHKQISISGSIQILAVNADTLRGTFSGLTADFDGSFFLVNVNLGQFALSGADPAVGVAGTPAAATPRLSAWPNPFNPRASVAFTLPRAETVVATVFDPAGRRVRTLHDGRLEQGEQRLQWDGRDQAGNRVPAGVYLVRARGERWQGSVKVVLAP
ncbi:MAG TPA: FlgD immunoglobulin-like domain containing protein [Candidatus Krumholzibacteria bacterium]|nr:FlgD immunoglobulin-like domain containing protein [Candidatus Krumholzibacteria bacterium]HPD73340.1 FlgD immunoglobulin-like domain containing protein [Candidatus Krumholzibacteria bacterium]HRY42139.1 FlgD immunoglobulin-like domain containing protein [Candidatus Krumholzibacteria bacterium]